MPLPSIIPSNLDSDSPMSADREPVGWSDFDFGRDELFETLLKLSSANEKLPTVALRHAINAIVHQQNDSDKAMAHQTHAIRALKISLGDPDPSTAIQSIATSMLLTIFEVA